MTFLGPNTLIMKMIIKLKRKFSLSPGGGRCLLKLPLFAISCPWAFRLSRSPTLFRNSVMAQLLPALFFLLTPRRLTASHIVFLGPINTLLKCEALLLYLVFQCILACVTARSGLTAFNGSPSTSRIIAVKPNQKC